ncbi:nitronate monooxygenase [Paenibacillus sp. TH7-28]
MEKLLKQLKGRLIVSCQAFPGEALYGSHIMTAMAKAAKDGGAAAIRANSPQDVAAIKEGGYTPYSPQVEAPDFRLLAELAAAVRVPVVAEGRIRTTEQAAEALRTGAFAVVVDTAITRPHSVTEQSVRAILGAGPTGVGR